MRTEVSKMRVHMDRTLRIVRQIVAYREQTDSD